MSQKCVEAEDVSKDNKSDMKLHNRAANEYFKVYSFTRMWYILNYLAKLLCYAIFTDVDECSTSPCLNNGTCTNMEGDFNCSCTAGWTGDLCQTGRLYIWIILVCVYKMNGYRTLGLHISLILNKLIITLAGIGVKIDNKSLKYCCYW